MNTKHSLIQILRSCTVFLCFLGARAHAENLIPEKPGTAPNYWCTWSIQNYMFGQSATDLDPIELEGMRGLMHARDAMDEKNVLGP